MRKVENIRSYAGHVYWFDLHIEGEVREREMVYIADQIQTTIHVRLSFHPPVLDVPLFLPLPLINPELYILNLLKLSILQ